LKKANVRVMSDLLCLGYETLYRLYGSWAQRKPVPNEALIYDFAHEDPGQGMVMPMVRVERIDYLVPP
jgi:hypothetical protein